MEPLPEDEYVNISTTPITPQEFQVPNVYFRHSSAPRTHTESVLVESLKTAYQNHHITITPALRIDLLSFANDPQTNASYTPHGNVGNGRDSLTERFFIPPTRRHGDANPGMFIENPLIASYDFTFGSDKFIVYIAEGHDNNFKTRIYYILVAPNNIHKGMNEQEKVEAQRKSDGLIEAATKWVEELHDEVLVFDGGWWRKNKELWENMRKASWDDVILEEGKKKAIVGDVMGFFGGEEKYKGFGVPWKRGIIFHGPPGNGKTISTKALMNSLSQRSSPTIPSLYVKSFTAFAGPEASIRNIFTKARQMAPCLLIFEDIDTFIKTGLRSYFFNEVDGLESNHGILMIASTNHLDRLDPGIAKRPSRFDRKYFFGLPDREERAQYAAYWRGKLRGNKEVRFPVVMEGRVADITEGFSFAYLKEAFVAALLVIVAKAEEEKLEKLAETMQHDGDDELKNNILWLELKKQVESLRKEMEDENQGNGVRTLEDSMKKHLDI